MNHHQDLRHVAMITTHIQECGVCWLIRTLASSTLAICNPFLSSNSNLMKSKETSYKRSPLVISKVNVVSLSPHLHLSALLMPLAMVSLCNGQWKQIAFCLSHYILQRHSVWIARMQTSPGGRSWGLDVVRLERNLIGWDLDDQQQRTPQCGTPISCNVIKCNAMQRHMIDQGHLKTTPMWCNGWALAPSRCEIQGHCTDIAAAVVDLFGFEAAVTKRVQTCTTNSK